MNEHVAVDFAIFRSNQPRQWCSSGSTRNGIFHFTNFVSWHLLHYRVHCIYRKSQLMSFTFGHRGEECSLINLNDAAVALQPFRFQLFRSLYSSCHTAMWHLSRLEHSVMCVSHLSSPFAHLWANPHTCATQIQWMGEHLAQNRCETTERQARRFLCT